MLVLAKSGTLKNFLFNRYLICQRKIYSGTLLSKNGAFAFGVFAGCTVLLALVLTLMAWSGSTNLGNQDFLDVAFPIYRMQAIIFIYIWLLGFNIYGWTMFHVNYKYLFSFKHHHSELWKVIINSEFMGIINKKRY